MGLDLLLLALGMEPLINLIAHESVPVFSTVTGAPGSMIGPPPRNNRVTRSVRLLWKVLNVGHYTFSLFA